MSNQYHCISTLFDTKIFTEKIDYLTRCLENCGVSFYFIKIDTYGSIFEYEYFFEDNEVTDNYIIYSERNLFSQANCEEGIMYLKHNVDKNLWSPVNSVLMDFFPNRTLGIMNNKDSLKIFFDEQSVIKPDEYKVTFMVQILFKNKIKDDAFPYFDKIGELIGKDIGYLVECHCLITEGRGHSEFNINIHKINEFKEIMNDIKKNKYDFFPKIKNIKLKLFE